MNREKGSDQKASGAVSCAQGNERSEFLNKGNLLTN
jgi:hypothetical protein